MTTLVEKNLDERLPPSQHRSGSALLRTHWVDATSKEPSTEGFIALLEAFRNSGGTVPGATVARLLEEHQGGLAVSLAKRVFTRQLFGFDWRANFWIPMFQFQFEDLVMKVEPQRVRAALPPQWSGWAVASWFASPNMQLDGRSPVDALDADFDAVLQAAGSHEWSESAELFNPAAAWVAGPLQRERRSVARL